MRKLLALLILLGIVVASTGCIREGDGGIIISFGNDTYTIPLNQTNTSTTPSSTATPNPTNYVYKKTVQAGQKLTIKETGFWVEPNYDVMKGKWLFMTSEGDYWDQLNITIGDITVTGKGVFVGTESAYAEITIISPKPLTIEVTEG